MAFHPTNLKLLGWYISLNVRWNYFCGLASCFSKTKIHDKQGAEFFLKKNLEEGHLSIGLPLSSKSWDLLSKCKFHSMLLDSFRWTIEIHVMPKCNKLSLFISLVSHDPNIHDKCIDILATRSLKLWMPLSLREASLSPQQFHYVIN